jgi:two-component system CheB/CheR fusion protein
LALCGAALGQVTRTEALWIGSAVAAMAAGISGALFDRVERRRAEEALRRREEQLRRAIIEAPIPIIMHAEDGEILELSREWCRLTGYGREEAPRFADWLVRLYGAAADQMAAEVQRLFDGTPTGERELVIRTRNGEQRVWSFAASAPGLLPDGRRFLVGMASDVTERKRVEAELLQAKEAAEAANSAKDRFLAALSHELRTPLTPVLARVSNLERERGLDGRLRRELAVVRRNVELEARLIDDLLDLTRITRGKLELRCSAGDLRAFVEHAVETCRNQSLAAKELRLNVELETKEHRVLADGPRMTQVFWNLLENAVKFTPRGGEIRVRSRHEDDGFVAVEVSDTGIGIEPDLLPRVFDAFEQGQRPQSYGGLGLGLAISKSIVELHGGTLTAASDGVERGATFRVRLPRAPAGLPVTQAGMPGALVEAETPAGRPLRLLLVEDHQDTAEAMADLLRARGHEVLVAGCVAEALECAAAHQHALDLVISDLGLPDGHGCDLMRELSARYQLPGIALSGFGTDEDVRRSREAGFARHLTKPVNIQALEAVILTAARVH